MNTTTKSRILRCLADAPAWVLVILALVITGNLASMMAIDIHPDEAYYWTWGIYPDLSYYDHPPMVGWFLWLINQTIGINDVTLRLPALLSWVVALWVVFRIASELYADRIYGWLAAAVFCMLPVFQAASHVTTPDSPLLLFVSLAYLFLFNATRNESSGYWLATGGVVGLAFLSKYNAVLVPISAFIGMIAVRQGRKLLLSWQPWASLGISFLLFLPVVYWNYIHDWISFSYQLGHGVKSGFRAEYLGIYIGGQLGAALIWIFAGMALSTIRATRKLDKPNTVYISILVSGFWVPLVFFGYAGATTIGEVNWPAMAYLPGTILLAGAIGKFIGFAEVSSEPANRKRRLLIALVLVVSTIFSITLVNVFRFPIAAKQIGMDFLPTNTQLSDTFGWSELRNKLVQFRRERGIPDNCHTSVSTKYIWASMVYQFRDVRQFSITPGMGTSQYEFWASTGVLGNETPCIVIERLPHDRVNHPASREWPGLGRWRLIETFKVITSDTPRIYGFYLPHR